jgi:hypothetical protein
MWWWGDIVFLSRIFARLVLHLVFSFNSDDELLFFSYFAYLASPRGRANATVRDIGLASLQQSWVSGVAASRSTLFSGMFLVLTGHTPLPLDRSRVDPGLPAFSWSPSTLQTLATVVWGLRTLPLELTEWPTQNSARLDVLPLPGVSGDGTRVLPANERLQNRWNADPYTWDGGSGMDGNDAGVFLLPYWLARYYGVIAA